VTDGKFPNQVGTTPPATGLLVEALSEKPSGSFAPDGENAVAGCLKERPNPRVPRRYLNKARKWLDNVNTTRLSRTRR